MNITPVDLREIDKHAANVYEAVIASARKARLINDENKLEFNTMLSALMPTVEDEFDERENPEQLKISLEFEKRPKPHMIALHELLEGKLSYRYKDKEEFEA